MLASLDAHFVSAVASFLGPFYVLLAMMNLVAMFVSAKRKRPSEAVFWLLFAILFGVLAVVAGTGQLKYITLPQTVRDAINAGAKPVLYTTCTTLTLIVLFWFRGFFVKPPVAWTIWNLMFLFLGLSMPDKNFHGIISKPDNVPIVMLVFLLAFFTWLATYRAVQNDERKKQGLPPIEAEGKEEVFVWPDLVYIELICMIALTALLIFWAIALQAPLEEAASPVKTPNPSKAPWYFLGLQEMLVYFDPWMAGVVLPSLIAVGLMAIPYIDFNKSGNGYYTINERRFSYIVFQIGFLEMWVTLIVLGTLLRGPNWNFFGPYEYWDAHKVETLVSVNLSEYVWQTLLGTSLPKAPVGAGGLSQFGYILLRESVGIVLVLGYFLALPAVLAVWGLKKYYVRMGMIRFMLMTTLLLFMASLPIKMVLRWSFNLKYLVAIPESFLNF